MFGWIIYGNYYIYKNRKRVYYFFVDGIYYSTLTLSAFLMVFLSLLDVFIGLPSTFAWFVGGWIGALILSIYIFRFRNVKKHIRQYRKHEKHAKLYAYIFAFGCSAYLLSPLIYLISACVFHLNSREYPEITYSDSLTVANIYGINIQYPSDAGDLIPAPAENDTGWVAGWSDRSLIMYSLFEPSGRTWDPNESADTTIRDNRMIITYTDKDRYGNLYYKKVSIVGAKYGESMNIVYRNVREHNKRLLDSIFEITPLKLPVPAPSSQLPPE